MNINLIRTYYSEGTTGSFEYNHQIICYSIELAWKNNMKDISCIKEGKYQLQKRYSIKHGWHLILLNTIGRNLILIHPANHAKLELRGCIAPVTKLISPGKGKGSIEAFIKLRNLVFNSLEKGEVVYLTILNKTETKHEGNI